jgi:RimJ/RimL family protein N-acetyltransferase
MAFSRPITDYWNARFSTGDVLHHDAAFEVRVDPGLFGNRQIVVLGHAGRTHAALTPQLAARAGLGRGVIDVEDFRRELVAAGLALHAADYLFYFPDAAQHALRRASSKPGVRPLDERDVAAFAAFQATASAEDLDGAFVELDHWAVYGAFEGDRLLCAASMYPWGGAAIADTGVLTAPAFRGQRHAREVVRAISRHALEHGHEPQYRCQTDNLPSVALAKAAGLALFGTWETLAE